MAIVLFISIIGIIIASIVVGIVCTKELKSHSIELIGGKLKNDSENNIEDAVEDLKIVNKL